MAGLDLTHIMLALMVTLVSGVIKGAIGFAMPMIMMSAFSAFLPAQVALALLIPSVLITNIQQAGRDGMGPFVQTVRDYRWHIGAVMIFICVSAPFAKVIPQAAMYLALGIPILAFALWQMSGRPLIIPIHHRRRAEVVTGIFGGLYGGISGIWGPPLIVYLLSIGASKLEQIRVQGVVFLIGAATLAVAHLTSGVLNAQTIPLALLMVIPAVLGMQLGYVLHDRLDLAQFRRWTLILLLLSALNLIRRGIEMI